MNDSVSMHGLMKAGRVMVQMVLSLINNQKEGLVAEYTYVYVHVCMYMYVYTCGVCTCMYMCVYAAGSGVGITE